MTCPSATIMLIINTISIRAACSRSLLPSADEMADYARACRNHALSPTVYLAVISGPQASKTRPGATAWYGVEAEK
ncbi:hypothetical protein AND_004603 [Anopheles darlingi]|uniref:Uncharacterized protein n=1 Tax=Anopheles darlingi TaxID=43151 RepID=W5JHT7_ANODA|nr:hypothetical protein AND_004603 [Anopheles darlingi]